jgi:DEAD/DEAH box helicase domain-containing protein
MANKIVFDIETKNFFSDVGSNDPTSLDISVVCIYDYDHDTYESFLEEDLKKLWPILEKAGMLIGYNSDHFDIPLLNKYYPGDLTNIKSLDLLKEIRRSLGRRVKLDQVAEGTLNLNKSGSGLMAGEWWKKGEIQKIIDYCLDDVKITKDLYEHALKNNELKFKEGGEIMPIKLDTTDWEEVKQSGMTHTLPF